MLHPFPVPPPNSQVEIMKRNNIQLFTSLWFLLNLHSAHGDASQLNRMLLKIEEDIHTFAHKVEDSLVNKCNFTTDETCYKANYDRCDSELPYATCPGGDYSNGRCGSGKEGGCGGLFDFTTSVATVAPDKNTFMPTEESDRVKDDVCTTLQLESYMKNVTESSTQYWQTYNVLPP